MLPTSALAVLVATMIGNDTWSTNMPETTTFFWKLHAVQSDARLHGSESQRGIELQP